MYEGLQTSLRRALAKPESELLADWYDQRMREEIGRGAAGLVSSAADLRPTFLAWLDRTGLQATICKSYCKQRSRLRQDPAALAALVTDVLLQIAGIPALATVTALVVKIGGEQLCQCDVADG